MSKSEVEGLNKKLSTLTEQHQSQCTVNEQLNQDIRELNTKIEEETRQLKQR